MKYKHRKFTFNMVEIGYVIEMDYDMISGMNVEKLKRYLRLRALRVTGRSSLVFSAVENEVQPVKSATEIGFEYSY